MTTFASERYSAAKEQLAGSDGGCRGTITGVQGRRLVGNPSHDQDRLGLAQLKMAESIGEKLRLAREAHGIALRDISEQTRISMRYLEAIESDDYRRLPGGVFNRSFIRAYAKFVGFDEQEAIEEYTRTLREHGESTDDVSNKPYRSLVYTEGGGHSRSPLMTLFLAVVILAVLSLCVWAGLHFYQRRWAPKPQPNRTSQRFAPGKLPSASQICRLNRSSEQAAAEIQTTMEGKHESAA